MKIAFLGKGGSGKSTLATAFVRYMQSQGNRVLAIDADHNMDLSYNLGVDSPSVFLGSDPSLIKRHIGVPDSMSFIEVRDHARAQGVSFVINPPDTFTSVSTMVVSENLLLMTAGPHTDEVRGGKNCSHSLSAPLKVFLPLLQLANDEIAIIDERAGTDPVATGILSDITLAVIVVEPTIHSARVARQIADELTLAKVPYAFVANKVRDDNSFFDTLPNIPLGYIPFGIDSELTDPMQKIIEHATQ